MKSSTYTVRCQVQRPGRELRTCTSVRVQAESLDQAKARTEVILSADGWDNVTAYAAAKGYS